VVGETKKGIIFYFGLFERGRVNEEQREEVNSTMELGNEHKKLVEKWAKQPQNLDEIGQIFGNLKKLMADEKVLSKLDEQSLIKYHRDVYELSVLYAIQRADLNAFKEAIAVVDKFYQTTSESTQKYLMIGLDLMYLLASNRLSDFHVGLEQLQQTIQTDNVYISTPVKLEQYLMEGSYNKILLTEKNMPSAYYNLFMKMLLDTVRSEIATSLERAFRTLATKEAAHLLLYTSVDEVSEFANKRGWKLQNGEYQFESTSMDQGGVKGIDTIRLVKQNIFYAKQLEMLV